MTNPTTPEQPADAFGHQDITDSDPGPQRWQSIFRRAVYDGTRVELEFDTNEQAKATYDAIVAPPREWTDDQIDAILSTPIPGGSSARMWFLPHETPRALENVRTVVRLMLQRARA